MRRIVLLVVLLLAFGGSMAALWAVRGRTRAPAQAEDYAHLARADALPSLFTAPDFSFTSHRGAVVTRTSLGGAPYVANFVFTTCRTLCPLLTARMVRLQRALPDVPMRFVSFSVDPERDTVEALAAYAQKWNASETRWDLLETTPTGLEALAAGFRITAERTDGGLDAVLHSGVFVLVDARGVVRGVFDAEDPTDFRALTDSARKLSGAQEGAQARRTGEVLFHELSCPACHEAPELAPPLGGVLGSRRELEAGGLITADEAYLRESILAPAAKRVRGYPLRMPSYEGALTESELNDLVQWIAHRPPPPKPEPDATVEVDPVCHMKVRVVEGTPSSTRALDGGLVHFCSAWCRDRFVENPDAFP